jgi:hypothetical protein
MAIRFFIGLQLDVPVVEFDGEFDVLAAVLLADFFGFLLNEGVEGVEIAGDVFFANYAPTAAFQRLK